MAKKKAAPQVAEAPGKVRFEVRFDEDVYNRVKALADEAQISVNQMMHALARWAGQHCKAGEPVKDEDGFVTGNTKSQPGCLWAGEAGAYDYLNAAEVENAVREWNMTDQYQMDAAEFVHHEMHKHKSKERRGKVWLFFDFTERRVIRED